jgi:hypothetical protein
VAFVGVHVSGMQAEDARPVRLDGVPTALYLRLHAQLDDLLRELELLDVGGDYGLPPYWQSAWEQAEAAERDGREHVDLELNLPPDEAARLSTLLEQADALTRAGLLLTASMPPAVRELGDWLVEELSGRLRDHPEP